MKSNQSSVRWSLASYVLVHDARGRVLLLKRHQDKSHFAGCWELPGGKPAQHESFDDTALVEVFEETGLDVKLTGVAGAAEGSVPGVRVAMIILEGRTRTTQVTLSDEHDEFRWLPLDEVCALKLRPGFDQFFADYTARAKRRLSQKPVGK